MEWTVKIGDRVSLRHRFGDTIRAHEGVVRKIDVFRHPSGHKDVWLEDFPDLICTDNSTEIEVLEFAKRTLKAGDTVTGEELCLGAVTNHQVLVSWGQKDVWYLWESGNPFKLAASVEYSRLVSSSESFEVGWAGK